MLSRSFPLYSLAPRRSLRTLKTIQSFEIKSDILIGLTAFACHVRSAFGSGFRSLAFHSSFLIPNSSFASRSTYGFVPCVSAWNFLPRKEVIQPHLPIRLPCYDFTPVIGLTFGSWPLAVTSLTSGAPNSHGVTGGVYKARERIHRGMLIRDY